MYPISYKNHINKIILKGWDRVIILLELVRGCDNINCASFEHECNYSSLNFMSKKTLENLVEKINITLNKVKNKYNRISIWPYGCGNTLLHPELKDILSYICTNLKGADFNLSTDVNSFIPNNWQPDNLNLRVMHKAPDFSIVKKAATWNKEYLNVEHGVVSNVLTEDMYNQLKKITTSKPIRIRPFHHVKFADFTRVKIEGECIQDNLLISPDIPIVFKPFNGGMVKRAMFSFDGKLQRCLINPTKHENLFDLLSDNDLECIDCFPWFNCDLLHVHDYYCYLEKWASCVSHGPLT